jgi:hydroxylamine dehydrogenase
MMHKKRRMILSLGTGTILAMGLLFLTYQFGVGPQGLKANVPTLSVALGLNKGCVECHEKKSPGVVKTYHDSKHSSRGVQCLDCHKPVAGQQAMTKQHEKVALVAKPSPKNCARCHSAAVKEFAKSGHAAKSWYAVDGSKDFTTAEMAANHLLDPKGQPLKAGKANPIATLIGKDASAQSCKVCHAVGRKNLDGSFGDCSKCHLRHTFEVAQARKPETCAQCHLGPDHPQSEVYNESAHGTYYQANKEKYNMDAPAGTLTVKDFPAPTCATCHMSGLGSVKGTHDVGSRLKWKLSPEIAVIRANGPQNQKTMNAVCLNCHTQSSIKDVMGMADTTIGLTNTNVLKGQAILAGLRASGDLGTKSLAYPIDFTYFELWHHEGRRARSGAVMGGPDFVNWHGIYEQQKALVELDAQAAEMKAKH